jgi:AraC-like DNA-binding protein
MRPVNLQDYILDSRLFRTFRVDDLLFVEYQCLIDEEQSEVWAHDNYFAYVLGGRKRWKTNRSDHLVGAGQALFVQKGAHTVYQYFEEPFSVLFIFLPDRAIRPILSKYPKLAPTPRKGTPPAESVISLRLNQVLESYFQSLVSYFSESAPPPPPLLKLKMEELVLSVLSQPDNDGLKRCLLRLAQRPHVDLEEIMRTHYRYPLSLNDFARLCARSLSTFRRDFKAAFNSTPAEWLKKERLAYSRLLLETTGKTVSEIVEESGFANRSHFTQLFKSTYGLTPLQFRRVRREGRSAS